jgi:hypothetical protein
MSTLTWPLTESPAERSFGTANGPKLVLVEVLVNLPAQIDIRVNLLEGSCASVDEPLAVGDDLGADEVLVVVLLDLGTLMLEILV